MRLVLFEGPAASSLPLPLDAIRLRPPLPRPGKLLACIANYWEHAQRQARPLNMFLKNPDAVIGPGDTVARGAKRNRGGHDWLGPRASSPARVGAGEDARGPSRSQ